MIWSLYQQQHVPVKLSFLTQPIFPLPTLKNTASGVGVAAYFRHITVISSAARAEICLQASFDDGSPPTDTDRAPPQNRVCMRADQSLSTHDVKVPTEALNGHDLFLQNQKVHEAAVLTAWTSVDAHTNVGLTRHLLIIHSRETAGRHVHPADNKEQGLSNHGGCILMSH